MYLAISIFRYMQKSFLNNINVNQLSSTTAPYETECVCMWFSIRIDTYMIKNGFKCHVLRLRHNDFFGKMFCVYYYLIILPDQFCVSKFLPSQLYTIIAFSFYFSLAVSLYLKCCEAIKFISMIFVGMKFEESYS